MTALPLLLAALAAAPVGGGWAVLGLKELDAPSIGATVELARGALGNELRDPRKVLDPEQIRVRLGLPPPDLAAARERLGAAELYYFQLELELARKSVAEAIEILVRAGGEGETWQWLRVARLLLASIDLAPGTPEARREAREALLPLVRVDPGGKPDDRGYPQELVELFDEAAGVVAGAPRGTLRARCRPACPRGHVWVDGASASPIDAAISLPEGRYHVVVTDSFDSARRRSLDREVEVWANDEAAVEVDLEAEGAIDSGDGPALFAPPEARLAAVVRAARLSRIERLLAVWRSGAGDERRLHVAVAGSPDGRIERQAQLRLGTMGEGAALERLVRFAVSGEALPGVEDAGLPEPMMAVSAELPAAQRSGWTTWGKWSVTAASVALGVAGTWLAIDAENREDRLQDLVAGWGGAVPAVHRDAARAEQREIGRRRDLGVGLLVGAGVAAVGATTFFLFENKGDSPR